VRKLGKLLVVVATATTGACVTTACGGNGRSDANPVVATTVTAYSAGLPATLAKAHDITFDSYTLVSRAEAEAIVNATVSAGPVRAGHDGCLLGGGSLTALVGLTWRVVVDPSARARIKALANTPSTHGVPVAGVGQEAVWIPDTLGAAAGKYRIDAGVTVDNVGDQAKSERLALTVISHLPRR
jgi:hypothetical protein